MNPYVLRTLFIILLHYLPSARYIINLFVFLFTLCYSQTFTKSHVQCALLQSAKAMYSARLLNMHLNNSPRTKCLLDATTKYESAYIAFSIHVIWSWRLSNISSYSTSYSIIDWFPSSSQPCRCLEGWETWFMSEGFDKSSAFRSIILGFGICFLCSTC
jgi:hypothetical protein